MRPQDWRSQFATTSLTEPEPVEVRADGLFEPGRLRELALHFLHEWLAVNRNAIEDHP